VSGRKARGAALAASFLVPAIGYALLWQVTAPDTLRQLGYRLWLRDSADDLVTAERMLVISAAYEFVVPVLVGVVGLVWGWRRWGPSRQRSASGGSQTTAE